jgi:hypothetical protein
MSYRTQTILSNTPFASAGCGRTWLAIASVILGACGGAAGDDPNAAAGGGFDAAGGADSGGGIAGHGMGGSGEGTGDSGEDPCADVVLGSTWAVEVVDDSPSFKPRTAVAIGADDGARLAYNTAESPDGWWQFAATYAEQAGDAFSVHTILAADQINNEYPTLALGPDGAAHVVFNRFVPSTGQIDVFLASGSAAGFGAPINLTETPDQDELGAVVARTSDGVLHVVLLQRQEKPESPGNYNYRVGYLQVSGGEPSAMEIIADPARIFTGDPEQSIAVDEQGRVHALFRIDSSDPARGQLIYRRRDPGAAPAPSLWSDPMAISPAESNAGGGSVAVDAEGVVHFTYGLGQGVQTMTYRSLSGGNLSPPVPLSTSLDDRAYYLGMKAADDGTVHVAYRRLVNGNADVFYRAGKGGIFAPEQAVTQTSTGDEIAAAVALDRCGVPVIAFTENLSDAPNGVLYLARLE